MLSHLKSYLFGASESAQAPANVCRNAEEEDWVLVESSEDVITELPNGGHDVKLVTSSLEESWIVTQEAEPSDVGAGDANVGVVVGGGIGINSGSKLRHRTRQPKGTKPRRLRAKKGASPAPHSSVSVDDVVSTTSSIAIIPGPEPRGSPAATSPILAASMAHVKQVAAIATARIAKLKIEKTTLSRKHLLKSNKTLMAASGRSNRRSHHVANRMCGSNNNRNSHYSSAKH